MAPVEAWQTLVIRVCIIVSQFDQKQEEKWEADRKKGERWRRMEKESKRGRGREAFKRILSVIDWLHSSANSHLKIMGLLVEIKASIVCLIAFWQMGADTTTRSIPPGTSRAPTLHQQISYWTGPNNWPWIINPRTILKTEREEEKTREDCGPVAVSVIGGQVPVEGKNGPFKRVPWRLFLGTGRTFR